MPQDHSVPRVGVGVFILNSNNEFVFGKRKGSHGQGTWALPGGHLELHESFEECAKREILEETGLEIRDVRYLAATNSPRIDGSKHYVTIFMVSRLVKEGVQPELLEPEKCESWEWVSWEEMLRWYEENKMADGGEKVGGGGKHDLFMPMIDLVEQCPGTKPV
ncbi:hypothetical protein PMZ80_002760 [Knufia obscura]|uniref:Nudix hydrolase domain-containing protein n=2 Tax=Knufia TaxID=430999 RepID=A0AAN8EHB5_9EURO|nr:hypothetical protein PMZ80_002760 [Knufia obscura]KAK5951533.1 hypothetical protein OHC33_007589 [Knufia fluminis]